MDFREYLPSEEQFRTVARPGIMLPGIGMENDEVRECTSALSQSQIRTLPPPFVS